MTFGEYLYSLSKVEAILFLFGTLIFAFCVIRLAIRVLFCPMRVDELKNRVQKLESKFTQEGTPHDS